MRSNGPGFRVGPARAASATWEAGSKLRSMSYLLQKRRSAKSAKSLPRHGREGFRTFGEEGRGLAILFIDLSAAHAGASGGAVSKSAESGLGAWASRRMADASTPRWENTVAGCYNACNAL